jgi:folate-dependent tRNA-U54 methylase TrmFO/GidA
VDRESFARHTVTERIRSHPNIELIQGELDNIPEGYSHNSHRTVDLSCGNYRH